MAIFDKAKEKFQGFMQGSEQANRNRRSNGGTSGYRPVRNQNPPQPQQEVPAGAFGGGVMPDTMFGGNAGFENVADFGDDFVIGGFFDQFVADHHKGAVVVFVFDVLAEVHTSDFDEFNPVGDVGGRREFQSLNLGGSHHKTGGSRADFYSYFIHSLVLFISCMS